jgi:hypothetical protein
MNLDASGGAPEFSWPGKPARAANRPESPNNEPGTARAPQATAPHRKAPSIPGISMAAFPSANSVKGCIEPLKGRALPIPRPIAPAAFNAGANPSVVDEFGQTLAHIMAFAGILPCHTEAW